MQLQRALALLESRDFVPAAEASRALLAGEPWNVGAKTVLALALGAQARAEDAAALLDQVARARPGEPHPAHALTGLLLQLGRREAIVPHYEACLLLAPGDASLRLALAEHLGDPERILAVLAPVLAADPDCLAGLMASGIALADLGRFDAAEAAFRDAVRVAPEEAVGWTNLAMMLKVAGRFEEGLAAADRAVALRPDDAQIRLNRAILKLRAGWLGEAWEDFDARLRLPGRGTLPPARELRRLADLPQSPQTGAPSGAGTRLLVVHEDGFGDTLHFIRYAPLLAARGVRVIAQLPRELAGLLRRMPGMAAVVSGDDDTLPEYDLHCHVCDLPRVFETTLATIPAAVPYLAADPALVAAWAARLPPRQAGVPRVGLAWAGQARPWLPGFSVLDSRRSMTLGDLLPLADVPGVQFVSLQKGPAAAQRPPGRMVLHDPMPGVRDFDDTAAIVAQLDVVVAVDTAVAHLAGALGRPVLLLDRYDNCWRWFAGRDDSPWYPTMRILRQERPGEWAPVLARAAAALAEMAGPAA